MFKQGLDQVGRAVQLIRSPQFKVNQVLPAVQPSKRSAVLARLRKEGQAGFAGGFNKTKSLCKESTVTTSTATKIKNYFNRNQIALLYGLAGLAGGTGLGYGLGRGLAKKHKGSRK